MSRIISSLIASVAVLAGCASSATLPVSAGMGPNPQLPDARTSLIPTVKVAKARGWAADAKPTATNGTSVTAFARGLDHPRWLYVLPNGDVLVAETNAPQRPDDGKGLKGWFFKHFQKKAGAAVPSANRITLLRDADGDGVAETMSVFLSNLTSPFGMALVGNTLYVANTDALVSFPYVAGQTQITAAPRKVVDLPGGTLNHHWTKSLLANPAGTRLYVGVGSNSNVAENGIEKEDSRAAIWEIDPRTGSHRVYATGLRNPVGLAWNTETGTLWASVNERDELGSDLVPDLVANAIVPDYALGPHTGSLGLAYSSTTKAAAGFGEGMFVGQHGSWNRSPRSGYKVIFVPFSRGRPSGEAIDVLTGFLDDDGHALGRPVGVAIDGRRGLLIADDVGNAVWRVTGTVSAIRRQ